MAESKTTERWENPDNWQDWKALLLVEMERHDWPFGKEVDPKSFYEFFNEGIGPHAAIEEAFNDAGI